MTTVITTTDPARNASSQAIRAGSAVRDAVPAGAAVAAWGAGLIEFALGAGAWTQGGAARGAGAALVALGVAALAWGAVTLVRGRIVVPGTGVAASLTGIAAGVTALAADPARTGIAAVAALAVLLLATAFSCAGALRASRDGRADASPPRVWAIVAAAVLVAAVATPALAATDAGRSAVPHGEHRFVDPGHH